MSKKLLLAVFLLFPLCSFAGSFNLSLGGGFMPKSGEYPDYLYYDLGHYYEIEEPGKLNSLIGTMKLTYIFKRFEVGAGFEYGSMQHNGEIISYPAQMTRHDGDKAFYYSKFFGPNIFGNINFPLNNKFSIYTGVTLGLLFSRGNNYMGGTDYYHFGEPTYGTFIIMEQTPLRPEVSSGWVYSSKPRNIFTGIQAGARYKFSSRLSAYAEVAPRIAFEAFNSAPYYSYNLFYFPMTLGVSCRVSKH